MAGRGRLQRLGVDDAHGGVVEQALALHEGDDRPRRLQRRQHATGMSGMGMTISSSSPSAVRSAGDDGDDPRPRRFRHGAPRQRVGRARRLFVHLPHAGPGILEVDVFVPSTSRGASSAWLTITLASLRSARMTSRVIASFLRTLIASFRSRFALVRPALQDVAHERRRLGGAGRAVPAWVLRSGSGGAPASRPGRLREETGEEVAVHLRGSAAAHRRRLDEVVRERCQEHRWFSAGTLTPDHGRRRTPRPGRKAATPWRGRPIASSVGTSNRTAVSPACPYGPDAGRPYREPERPVRVLVGRRSSLTSRVR